MHFKNKFKTLIWRDGKIVDTVVCYNEVTTSGRNLILDVMFKSASAVASWYIGLIDKASFSEVTEADTLASHAGWLENTDYSSPLARGLWPVLDADDGISTNTITVDFTMNADVTIKGLFLCSVNSGTTGTLWATALYDNELALISGNILQVIYTVEIV